MSENNVQVTEIIPGTMCILLKARGCAVKPLKSASDNVETILVASENIVEVMTYLKMHKDTQFDILLSVCGVDYPDRYEVVYHIFSSNFKNKLVLKTHLNKNNPEIVSISEVFSAANWHERETYDLMGIKFINHPELERILLPKDWIGHPLRKDYKMQDERLVWNER